jgi:hypothetical protein
MKSADRERLLARVNVLRATLSRDEAERQAVDEMIAELRGELASVYEQTGCDVMEEVSVAHLNATRLRSLTVEKVAAVRK